MGIPDRLTKRSGILPLTEKRYGHRVSSRLELARKLPPVAAIAGFRALRAGIVLPEFVRYLRSRRRYKSLPGAEPLALRDSYPILGDRVATTPFDSHYLYQDTWAVQRIAEVGPAHHIDVGSRVEVACFLTAICDVSFVDIRPLLAIDLHRDEVLVHLLRDRRVLK